MVSEIIGLTRVDKAWLDERPNLKVLGVHATGLDHVDLQECEKRGIKVISLRGEKQFLKTIPATAEHTIGLILSFVRRIPWAFYHVLEKGWNRNAFVGGELKGKTILIVGYGRIGRMVGKYARTFGMHVFSIDYKKKEDLLPLLGQAAIVTLHIPLECNEGYFDADCFEAMQDGALFVNTSRGGVVDEDALLRNLELGRIGAILDVVKGEPNDISSYLLDFARNNDNILITPHLGGATIESMAKTKNFIAQKVEKCLKDNV